MELRLSQHSPSIFTSYKEFKNLDSPRGFIERLVIHTVTLKILYGQGFDSKCFKLVPILICARGGISISALTLIV